jgi:ParB-like chromosome segregation protein Spo0J
MTAWQLSDSSTNGAAALGSCRLARPRFRGGQTALAVVSVALADLRGNASFREAGINDEHVQRLVDLGGQWPPILVSRSDGVVIDGVHRAAAAHALGWERIDATLFDGPPDEAVIEFVRRNMYHGLPLTLRDRKHAAARLLAVHPEWSDRRIAEVCAVSPKTVGRLRPAACTASTEENPQFDPRFRIGRDNKRRPATHTPVLPQVLEANAALRGASLRSVAARAGASPETVRIVRSRLRQPLDEPETPAAPDDAMPVAWHEDLALVSCDGGEDFVSWFERTLVTDDECWGQIDRVPLSRIYEIADEARRRSNAWTLFARALEARVAKRN